jgi:hypothetical protein
MGRYYYGDIEGKFWFGIQSSDDVCELVSCNESRRSYTWKSCGCCVDDDNPIQPDKYCRECFDSLNNHIDTVCEEDDYEDELLYIEEQNISYSLDKDTHYQELLDSMNKIKLSIHKDIISEFDKIEQNDKILNAFSGVFNHIYEYMNKTITYENESEKHKSCVLVARYTLGFQIEYCLRKNNSCNITCEL